MRTFQLYPLWILTLVAFDLFGQAAVTTPRPSTAASVTQTVGISTVSVTYSRPSVRDREIWGKLVPYGWNKQGFGNGASAPWRAGANENTVVTFSHDVQVEGQHVPAGSYGLFFVINEDNTGEVILSKDYRSWGSFWYEPAQDLLRAPIQLRDNPLTEMLTYDFINVSETSAELVLNWEKKQFPIKIEFEVDRLVMANAAQELKGVKAFNWQGFASAANYSVQNKIDVEQGYAWADRAMTMNRNFQTLQLKSRFLKERGKEEEANKLMEEGMRIATEVELNNYGYQLLGQNEFDKAIAVLTLNTERFPNSANVWDSLGEAYALKGDKKNAVKSFKKSLSLNPPANVRANSEKYLKEFGAM